MVKSLNVPHRPTILIIMDGVGVNPSRINNGMLEAKTPRLDEYFSNYPHTTLLASGRAVGLPDGQMGNSEVGHLTIGSGTIMRQYLVRIDDAIADDSFFENQALCAAADTAKASGQPLHLIGMVSDGGVHSHVRHLIALIDLARKHGVRPLLHMITDGRDTAPRCAANYLPLVEEALQRAGGAIATVSGRYYAMDRDRRWERTELAWNSIVLGKGKQAQNADAAIEQAYQSDEGDEFITPTVLPGFEPIGEDSVMIFFNFRNDRPRQMTEALIDPDFNHFDRGDFKETRVTCLTEYGPNYLLPVAFDPDKPGTTLGEIASHAGIRQFHCAETEKYAHVTFFFNGGREEPYAGETRVMVPSPKVATYDLQPEMSAEGVADAAINAIESGEYGLIVLNFANGDMVGHTAVHDAIITAIETLDTQVGRVLDYAVARDYAVVLTADHGNCEEIVDPATKQQNTQHTTYPVPCLIIDRKPWRLTTGAGLSSLARTVLDLMGLKAPDSITGKSLLLEQAD